MGAVSPTPGQRLGRYCLLEQIGAGGMGAIFRARDERLERDVAIKVLPAGALADEAARKHFRKEALALSRLNHPNIATVHDFDSVAGLDFIVTELVLGVSLSHQLARGSLPEKRAAELGIQLAEGLAAAHAAGVLHRDLKPANLKLTAEGRLKILDFGSARVLPRPDDVTASTVTLAQSVAGTLSYMAPELLRGEWADERADIWSAGATLFEMATGQRPFIAMTATMLADAILHEHPPAPRDLNADLSAALEQAILKCLDKDPENRYQSAKELIVDLRRLSVSRATAAVMRGSRRSGLAVTHPRRTLVSLAVLPFANSEADPGLDYLSEGLGENLTHTLSKLPKLRVKALSTVKSYKRRAVQPQAIGRALDVSAVLTGRVRQKEGELLVSCELIDVETGDELWGEQYRSKLSDILAVQAGIASEISKSLRLKLTSGQRKRLARPGSMAAYQAYLKGRYHWNKRTAEGFKQAIAFFEEAIEHDPAYPLAYAGLADCYNVFAYYRVAPAGEAFPKAKAAAERALEIDETLVEGYASLAYAKLCFDWSPSAAEQDCIRAIELNPDYARAHQCYSFCLLSLGRMDESVAQAEQARTLDPFSRSIAATAGWPYYFARRYQQAVERYRDAIDLEASFFLPHHYLGMTYSQLGQHERAIGELSLAVEVSGGNSAPIGALGHAYGVQGNAVEARKCLERLNELSCQQHVSAYDLALVQLSLGEIDSALDHLQEAVAQREPLLIWLKWEPMFDPVRSHPRFQFLLHKITAATD